MFSKSFQTKDCLLSLSLHGEHEEKIIRIISVLILILKYYEFQKVAVAFVQCDNWIVGIHIIGGLLC